MRRTAALAILGAAIVVPLTVPAGAVAQDRNCSDFSNQAEAQQYFEQHGGPASDPDGLDGDGDGVACESLPCPCSSGSPSNPPPVPPASNRTVERVTAGNVTAELSYIKKRIDRYTTRFRSKRVRIIRDGAVLRDEAVPSKCDSFCTPARAYLKAKSIRLRDVTGDGEPEVLVDLFTGGANCCFYTLAYGFQPASNTYARAARNFGGYGYRLRDLDGKAPLEFQSGDERFYGAFSCGACAALPIQIWSFSGESFANVSRQEPSIVRRDARHLYRLYLRNRRRGTTYVRGLLTPYVAEQCLLGRCRAGLRTVDRARRRGYLKKRGQFVVGPYGRSYVKRLKRFLRRTGYLH
jgi:hypothetical protein